MLFLHQRTGSVVGEIVEIRKISSKKTFFRLSACSRYSDKHKEKKCYRCFDNGTLYLLNWYRSKDIMGIFENIRWVHGNFLFYRGF